MAGVRTPAASAAAPSRRLAIIGGGWAGLAAAVGAVERGWAVTLHEAARDWGGRARSSERDGTVYDQGQHILIGAYRDSLGLLQKLGVDIAQAFDRRPLALVYPDGRGLRLPRGAPALAFARGVLRRRGWSWRERAALLAQAARWRAGGFDCAPQQSVAQLCAALPARVRDELIEPLCVAALNTPAADASAQVFLRVLRDALFAGPGSADLMLPRRPLAQLLPQPATRWLAAAGATLRAGTRVIRLEPLDPTATPLAAGWSVDGEVFDAVLLACSAAEAARLAAPLAPAWAQAAAALRHEAIATAYLHASGAALDEPMCALPPPAPHDGPLHAPAQFVFDLGRLRGEQGLLACVASGAGPLLEAGLPRLGEALRAQAQRCFAGRPWASALRVQQLIADKRATFVCAPQLARPAASIAPGLAACGDYIAGPYPAPLEGAVRSGLHAAQAIG